MKKSSNQTPTPNWRSTGPCHAGGQFGSPARIPACLSSAIPWLTVRFETSAALAKATYALLAAFPIHEIQPVKSRVVQASLTSFALGLTVLVGATGCKSVKPADPTVKAIKVTERHKMIVGASSIQLPAGIYHPEFTTGQGVYYRAPNPLVTTGLGSDTVEGGGVYLPNSSDPDNRQGAWLDREERLFGFGVQTPTKVFRFREQIPFETLTESTAGSSK